MRGRGVLLQRVDERHGADRVEADEDDGEAGRTRLEGGEAVAGCRHAGRAHAQLGQQPHERVGTGVERLDDQRIGHAVRKARGRRQGRAAREGDLHPEGAAAPGCWRRRCGRPCARRSAWRWSARGRCRRSSGGRVSACVNGRNSRPGASGVMPMPVSATSMRTRRRPARSRPGDPDETCPAVNLIALPSRLTTTWRSRDGSPRKRPAQPALDRRREVEAGRRGLHREQLHGVLDDEAQIESERLERDEPARLDLGEVEDVVDDRRAARRRRCGWCRRTRAARRERRLQQQLAMPRMPFIGVRISWLIAARKSLFGALRARRDRGPPRARRCARPPAVRGWPASRRPARRCRRPAVPAGW